MDEHTIPLKELYSRLRSSEQGLAHLEVEKRLKEFGPNVLETRQKFVYLLQFLQQFTNFFALLLLTAAILALVAESVRPGQGNQYIGIALVGVVIINAIFTFLQQYRSEKIMEKFQKMLPPQAEVGRDGKRQKILASQLVPGDIIFLSEGDKVPADSRLIEENALKVDHSSITGESEPQLRSLECTHENILESRNMLFSGTLVQSGDGKAIVYSTGNDTQVGKIMALTKETADVDTPLHRELHHFIWIISAIALTVGTLFFLLGLLRDLTLISSLIFAVGIIVANVPEGLLPTVTLALSLASRRMARRNALVRNLESVETLGATTVICTDKTGTLTENKMTVTTLLLNLEEFPAADKKASKAWPFSWLLRTMVLCNNAHSAGGKKFVGDPTETALLDYARQYQDVAALGKREKRFQELPFDSKTKRMITLNQSGANFGAKRIAYLKGAPEVVERKCTRIMLNDKILPFTPARKKMLHDNYRTIASRGERVLAFAYQEMGAAALSEGNFIFLGLVGMTDPPRPGVPEAIQKCKTAGIKVIMITGDHSLTAASLGRKIGLLEAGKKATIVTGDQLETMDEDELKQVLKKENLLFARSTPVEKLRIVKALQVMGEVVTVTGDGVNDAPALKSADMGVAMGKSGTDVAREASDLVLLDDNFATIVNAVEEGRTIFDNIRKFITYILTSNLPEIIPFIAFALLNLPLAITIILILSIDLGTDLLPAIALGSEKPEEDVMHQKPRSRKEKLLTKWMLIRAYLLMGMIQAVAGFFAFFTILGRGGWKWGQELAAGNALYQKAVTAFFAAVVVCQIANVFICRARREPLHKIGFFSNKLVWLGIAAEIALLLMIVYLPQTQLFFGTAPLTLKELLLGIPFALLMIFIDGTRKYLLQRKVWWVEKYGKW